MVLSLSLTLGARWFANYEFDRSNVQQRGGIRLLARRAISFPLFENNELEDLQHQQEVQFKARLDDYTIAINIIAFVVGGAVSWWFAGRTLKPIEESHEAQQRFAADASHELRTPLTAMRTENEVFLRQKSFDKAEAKQLITSNLEEVERLDQLVGNLLLLAEYEKASLKRQPVAVEAFVNSAIDQQTKLDPKLKKRLTISLAKGKVNGHEDSLAQLVTILLDNAYKYSPAASPIAITGVIRDNQYDVIVDDSGPGVTPEDWPHVFDRLYRGDKARSSTVPGHGLGLSLAQEIARANHGQITLGSSPTGGARFTVTLPKV